MSDASSASRISHHPTSSAGRPGASHSYRDPVNEERLLFGDVPVRLYEPAGARAVLLLGHGGGHSKDSERFVRLSRHYADQLGLAVACIDAVDHGERRQPGAEADVPPGWHSQATPQMIDDWHDVVGELSSIGPALTYVGFSMGVIFGVATVATMPTITATVFVAGGIPNGDWTDDDDLEPMLVRAAGQLDSVHVLMLNNDDDERFHEADVRRLFNAISAPSKSLRFFPGSHDEWGPAVIDDSVRFLAAHLS
jgi:dienelactone hydrolase